MIQLDDVWMRYPVPKRYRELLRRPLGTRFKVALQNVSLHVSAGECRALMGINGAGKTTLLKLIGGLLYPWQGCVRIDGHESRRHPDRVRRQVGFVLNEERSFYWRLTGRQNLCFFGSLNNLRGRSLARRIDTLLDLTGLSEAGEHRVSDYSCGMRQRLAIARGLLADPQVLILDEPTKSLDPMGADDLRTLIDCEICRRQGKTLILATHQPHEAERLCNRVCVIRDGRLLDSSEMQHATSHAGGLGGYLRHHLQQREARSC